MGYYSYFDGELELNKKLTSELIESINTASQGKPFEHPLYDSYWEATETTLGFSEGEHKWASQQPEALKELIKTYLEPKGYVLDGEIYVKGEDFGDFWKISVKYNEVKIFESRIVYEDEEPKDQTFGNVSWNTDDIKSAITDIKGIEHPTEEMINSVLNEISEDKLCETMIAAGGSLIDDIVNEIIKD